MYAHIIPISEVGEKHQRRRTGPIEMQHIVKGNLGTSEWHER